MANNIVCKFISFVIIAISVNRNHAGKWRHLSSILQDVDTDIDIQMNGFQDAKSTFHSQSRSILSNAPDQKYSKYTSQSNDRKNCMSDRTAGCETCAMNCGYYDGIKGTKRDAGFCCCFEGDYNEGYDEGQNYRQGYNQGVLNAKQDVQHIEGTSEELCSKCCPDCIKACGCYFCGCRCYGHPGYESGQIRGEKEQKAYQERQALLVNGGQQMQ